MVNNNSGPYRNASIVWKLPVPNFPPEIKGKLVVDGSKVRLEMLTYLMSKVFNCCL
jgi:hypothetical protein